jgi:hypothetical protein
MTTQPVTFSLAGTGGTGGRAFSGTATDAAFTSISTTTGAAELGFALKGKVINNLVMNFTAGNAAWVIKNRVTNTYDAVGFGSVSAATNPAGGQIMNLAINQDHILQSYTLAAGTTYLAWVKMAGRPSELFTGTIANGSEGEITTLTDSSSVGSFADQVLESITVQGPTGKIVQITTVYDANGGEIFSRYGGELASFAGTGGSANVSIDGIGIKISRGMTIKLTVQA